MAFTWHVGPYDTISQGHAALAAWIEENGRTAAGPVREVYWTDPGQEPDSSRWKTELLMPIEPA